MIISSLSLFVSPGRLEERGAVHVLHGGAVVVLQGELVGGLHKVLVVDASDVFEPKSAERAYALSSCALPCAVPTADVPSDSII